MKQPWALFALVMLVCTAVPGSGVCFARLQTGGGQASALALTLLR